MNSPGIARRRASSAWIALSLFVAACHDGEPFDFRDPEQLADGGPKPSVKQTQLALGVGFSCALLATGEVQCWGSNAYGVLGLAGPDGDVVDPSHVPALDFGTSREVIAISAGWHHVCVLFEDGKARCWGRNDDGQLGQGNTNDYGDEPHETLAALGDVALEGVTRIAAGVRSTCVIVGGPPGEVHCFGSDDAGALGDASSGDFGDDEVVDASRPVMLPALALEVATGADLACALLDSRRVHCWGDNWAKTLGIGDSTCNVGASKPCFGGLGSEADIPVAGLGTRSIRSIVVNQASACAIDELGALFCWGRNSQSRLGYPEQEAGEYLGAPPGAVNLGRGVEVESAALGVRHACVLDTAGKVRCFGEQGPALGYAMEAETGVTGIGGSQTPAEAFAQRADEGVVNVGDFDDEPGIDGVRASAAGHSSTCVLTNSGDVRCWGANQHGQLGYGPPSEVGSIGDDGTPGQEYERLGRASVRFANQ